MGLSWHKVSASSKTGKLCTTHFICGNLILSQRLTDPILADVVSRQFRAAYWLITTKLIHMSWSEILPSLVILSLFTFELHVIEIFLPNSVFDPIYPSVAILVSRQFRAAYWLMTTKILVVDGTLLTQISASSKTGKLCTTHFICGNLFLSQRLRYPILADVVSRQFRAAYWLITTKTLVVDRTPFTQNFSFIKDWEIMYHSLYMWKSCSEPTPYGSHIGWRCVTLVQGGILADYGQIDTHVLKWNPAKFGYPKSLHIRATRDWNILSKLRFDAIYPSVTILVSRQFRPAYWLITIKTLVVDGTLLTQSFSCLKD